MQDADKPESTGKSGPDDKAGRIEKQGPSAKSGPDTNKPGSNTKTGQSEKSESKTKSGPNVKEVKAFYICFGFVITYVLLWLPSVLIKMLEYFGNIGIERSTFAYSIAIANLNPISDSIIFAMLNKDFRGRLKVIFAFVDRFLKLRGSNRQGSIDSYPRNTESDNYVTTEF